MTFQVGVLNFQSPKSSKLVTFFFYSLSWYAYFSRLYCTSGRQEIRNLGLWGNYSVPKDNPYSEDKELLPEIWALGLRNPWRCSFDSERPLYFICADTGQV